MNIDDIKENNKVKRDKLALILSITAIIIAVCSVYISYEVKDIAYDTSLLGIEPKIGIKADLNSDNEGNGYIGIKNTGTIDVVDINIEMYEYRFSSGMIHSSFKEEYRDKEVFWENKYHWEIENLKVNKEVTIEFEVEELNNRMRLFEDLKYKVIIVIKIDYFREPGREKFSKRSFYIMNDEGICVNEKDDSVTDENYRRIFLKASMIESSKKDLNEKYDKLN